MWRYLTLLSFRSMSEIDRWKAEVAAGANPRDYKIKLAEEIISRFHNSSSAARAHESFITRFQKGGIPDDIPNVQVEARDGEINIANLLKSAALCGGTSEAMRMIKQGAVRIDGEKVSDPKQVIKAGSAHVYQVGKRKFAKVDVR
jgi:tyrosyl-tRNA synthetase